MSGQEEHDIEAAVSAYLSARDGDVQQALRAAVSDLLETQEEAEMRFRALDQWVSRGYVQGRASDVYRARVGPCATSTP